jgi:general secretion pathway protein A
MDFLSFFGLREDPFKLTPDPAYFYPSATHNEGLLLLNYSIEQKEGFTTVVGDPGSGKTTLLNVFLETWRARSEIAIVLTPRLSPEEFMVSVLEDIGVNLERKNKNEIIKAFRDFMIEKSSEGKWVIIIVDEAQNLPDETLEELRLLSNLETDKDKLLQVVLLGQPELESKLMSDRLRQLNQRITTRIYLRHFTLDETLDYINYRIIKAGKQNLLLDKKAGKIAYKLSKGIPRLINMLLSRALMAAYLEESNIILPRHISHAVKSLNHSEMKMRSWIQVVPLSAGIMVILLLMILAVNTFVRRYHETPAEPIMAAIDRAHKPSEVIAVTNANENNKYSISPDPSSENKGINPLPLEKRDKEANDEKAAPGSKLSTHLPEKEAPQSLPYKILAVKVDVANVRDEPKLDSSVIGKLLNKDQLVAYQEYIDDYNTKWYEVSFRGERKWIAEDVVDVLDIRPK